MTKKNKNKKDWYDTHVEVLSFGSSTQDKKLKNRGTGWGIFKKINLLFFFFFNIY